VVLAALLCAARAEAGRRPFIWVWDTEIVPEGEIELEQWLWVRGSAPVGPVSAAYWVWWGPVIGLNSNLELAVPFQVVSNKNGTALESFEADLRWRIFPREKTGGFQPLVRVAWHQQAQPVGPPRLDVNVVASYGSPDELHVTVDLGGRLGLPMTSGSAPYTAPLLATYAAGVAYPFFEGELRVAAEVFGEIVINPGTPIADSHHFFGLDVAWTKGRLWLTAGTLIGLTPLFPRTPVVMPRLIWAVAL
jgi:hypothetical protein